MQPAHNHHLLYTISSHIPYDKEILGAGDTIDCNSELCRLDDVDIMIATIATTTESFNSLLTASLTCTRSVKDASGAMWRPLQRQSAATTAIYRVN
jgi:hypothetical protein